VLRESGWLVPAYTFPANRTDLTALRVVVRNGFSHDMADMLVDDLKRATTMLARQAAPMRGAEFASFAHGAGSRRHRINPHPTAGQDHTAG
jgi:glutamate decarboxylase